MAAQASTITRILIGSSKWIEEAFSVYYQVNSAEVYMRMVIYMYNGVRSFELRTVNIGQKAAGSQSVSITLTAAELARAYDVLPTREGSLEVRLYSYSDANYTQQVGYYSQGRMDVVIPVNDSTRPELKLTVEPVNDYGAAFNGLFIKGKTRMKVTVQATPKHYASITSCEIAWFTGEDFLYTDYETHSQLSVTLELPMDGMTSLVDVLAVGVTDSRGISALDAVEIVVIDYTKPTIDAKAYRCDSAGNENASGTYMRIRAKRGYSKVMVDGVQKNFCEIMYRMRKADGDWSGWTTILKKTDSPDEVTTGVLYGNLETKSSYAVQIRAVDDLGEYGETASGLPTEEIYMHRHKNGLALGKYVENGDDEPKLLDVAWNAHFRGEVLIGPDGKTLREYILSVINEGG